MNYRRILTLCCLITTALQTQARECEPFAFHFPASSVMRGEFLVSWSINPGCAVNNNRKKRNLLVQITNMFEDVFYEDTTSLTFLRLNTKMIPPEETHFLVILRDPDGKSVTSMAAIKIIEEPLPDMPSAIDSLNNFLLNGYFVNALLILHDLGRYDLLDDLRTQYDMMTMNHGPFQSVFFNTYLDQSTLTLVQMPYVKGIPEFLRRINEVPRTIKDLMDFKIYATVDADGQLLNYEVYPAAYRFQVEDNIHSLQFINSSRQTSLAVIRIGPSMNIKKKYIVTNERALTPVAASARPAAIH